MQKVKKSEKLEVRGETYKKKFPLPTSHFPLHQGFTLIELLVVFSFIGILTSLGIAAYSAYNGNQAVTSSAKDIATLLNTAKAQSLSQVIPSGCGNNPLTGYQVNITPAGQQYTLSAMCGSAYVVTSGTLPSQVTFASGSTASISFIVASGIAASPANIIITGYGKTKTITVSKTGNIMIQ